MGSGEIIVQGKDELRNSQIPVGLRNQADIKRKKRKEKRKEKKRNEKKRSKLKKERNS